MKNIGYMLIGIGVLYVIIAFNMNVSISSPGRYVPDIGFIGGGDVANLDLMARRQNHLIVASLTTLVGVLLAIFGPTTDANSTNNLRSSRHRQWRDSERRDLSSDAYRLWLAQHYKIERNEMFDRFVLDEQTFENLNDAVAHAHDLELQKIANEMAEEQRREEQANFDRENALYARDERQARWREAKPKLIVAVVMTVALVAAAYFIFKPSSSNIENAETVAVAENDLVAEVRTEFAPREPIQLGQTLKFSSPSQCEAAGTLEKVYKKLDSAMEAGTPGFNVKLDELSQPLTVIASKAEDDDGAITSESSVRFPENVEWNGLMLSRIKTSQYSPPETDSVYSRYVTFRESPDKVMRVLNELDFRIQMAPSYSNLTAPDDICGGSMQLESISGGSSLSCSWGC